MFCVFVFRISYSVYELQKLKEVSKPNIQLIVVYDVACILSKHIQVKVLKLFLFVDNLCYNSVIVFPS